MATEITVEITTGGARGPQGPPGNSAFAPLPLITGRTGGTETDLDALTTTGSDSDAVPGDIVLTRTGVGGSTQFWWLRAGTDAEDAAGGIVRPDDYNASTNAYVWQSIS